VNPETKAFLATVRNAEDPSREDERRVLAAVGATVAGGVGVAVAASGSKLLKAASRFGPGSVGVAGVKVTVVVLGLAGAVSLATPESPRHPTRSEAAAVALDAPTRSGAEPPKDSPVVPSLPVEVPTTPSARVPLPRSVARTGAEKASAVAPARPFRAPTAREELTVLAEAQAALRGGDGIAALRLLDASSGADPRFFAERRALRILSLCAAGRTTDARREATAFLRSDPTSVQRNAVARSCAAAKLDQAR
jgi:hypothetical protein